jgi:hypothetical protein
MKKLVSFIIGVLCILVSLQGCKCGFFYKCDDDLQPMPYGPFITGKWQLHYYSGGFGGEDSVVSDKNWYLFLNEDRSYKETVQGQLKSQGNYSVSYYTDSIYKIRFGNSAIEKMIFLRSDTMELRDIGSDLYDYIYKKVP